MNWLVRFTLGLAARPVDVAELRENAPELLEEGRDVRVMPLVVLVHPRTFEDDRAAFASAVRTWAADVEARGSSSAEEASRDGARAERQPRDDGHEATPCVLVDGDARARFEAFLALVARVHESGGPARRVLVRDARLFAEDPDDGTSPGFERLCRYLGTLWLADEVTLLVGVSGPSERKADELRARWASALGGRFAAIRVASASREPRLPDGVTLVEHEGGDVRGVVGPSMAAAGDADVALLGELTVPRDADLVASWLTAAAPARGPAKTKKRGRT